MSGDSGGNQDFVEQLRLQELYGQQRDDGDDPHTFTDPEDGTVYNWDHDKKAWFPKITEDFMAAYQASYGFSEDGAPAAAGEVQSEKPPDEKLQEEVSDSSSSKEEEKKTGEKRKAEPGWFNLEQEKNTNVYVSGLPLDITPDEFVELMSKCGIIMRDPMTEEYKVKLYKDGEGNQKGDGLCCYLKRESVALAERLLDEYEVRGYRLHVEAARFELKGQYDASKKKKKNKEYRKKMQQQQRQLDWRPEKKKGEVRKRHERVVIIQNMFHPTDFEEDPLVLNEYRDDLRSECEKFGEVKKLIIFDRHPDGVASVAFSKPEEADACVGALNARWFGGRQLSAQLWDGATDYQVDETVREREERLKGWSVFLGEEATQKKQLEEGGTRETEQQEEGKEKQEEGKEKQEEGKEKREEGKEKREEGKERREEGKEKQEEGKEKREEGKERREEGKEKREEGKEKREEGKEKREEGKEKREELEEATVESTDSSLVGSDEES